MEAIARAEHAQALVIRPAPRMARGTIGYATVEAVATEQAMLALEAEGRGRFAPLHSRIHAARIVAAAELASADQGHHWTDGQRSATRGLLLSTTAVTAIQGSAGTAKTATVLATYARAARDERLILRALAPTATAADVLGRAVNAEPMTVAKMLTGGEEIEQGCEAWIVNEASMLSARDAERLLALARDAGARLVLVGDVGQLGSVGAGRAFGQLQDAGMQTHVLDQIVRQTNRHGRMAIMKASMGRCATNCSTAKSSTAWPRPRC